MDNKTRVERARILGWCIILVFFLLSSRLWYLQVVQGQKYAAMADGNRIRWVRTVAPRGRVFDRNGVALATNRASFTVSLMPGSLDGETREHVLTRLSQLLCLTRDELEDAIAKGIRYPYEPIRVMQDVPAQTVVALEERRFELPGVLVEMEEVREYPQGSLASHVLGYMAPISPELLSAWSNRDYYGSDYVGFTGLERLYESILRGQDGGSQVEVSALNRPVQILERTPAIPGSDLILTLDRDLQDLAEYVLLDQLAEVRAAGKYPDTYSGVVIILNPKDGAILALASMPGYDPNLLSDAAERSAYYVELSRDKERPLFNRAIQGLYSPGSAFKPLTAIAALEEGKTTVGEVFYADDIGPFGIKRCWTLRNNPPLAVHGNITIVDALEVSCNDFFWEMGLRLGIDALAKHSREAGFGSPTGIVSYPSEEAGVVPDPEWKRQRFARRPRSEQMWYPMETMDMAIGQGFLLATPLQMAAFYMGLANRGPIYVPYIVERVQRPTGEVVEVAEPKIARMISGSPANWEAVIQGMVQVVETGTGSSAFRRFPYPVKIAGKTGSVQLGPGQGDAHSWFCGFAPADDPEIVVVAFAEHGGGGAVTSGPMVRRIMEAYFRRQFEPEGEAAANGERIE
ncbi:MAG: penicillin-binding protein 2 [Firmicutes bacterium]|nr:penicillin-binding protein 2 [Bacillota bacterium]